MLPVRTIEQQYAIDVDVANIMEGLLNFIGLVGRHNFSEGAGVSCTVDDFASNMGEKEETSAVLQHKNIISSSSALLLDIIAVPLLN